MKRMRSASLSASSALPPPLEAAEAVAAAAAATAAAAAAAAAAAEGGDEDMGLDPQSPRGLSAPLLRRNSSGHMMGGQCIVAGCESDATVLAPAPGSSVLPQQPYCDAHASRGTDASGETSGMALLADLAAAADTAERRRNGRRGGSGSGSGSGAEMPPPSGPLPGRGQPQEQARRTPAMSPTSRALTGLLLSMGQGLPSPVHAASPLHKRSRRGSASHFVFQPHGPGGAASFSLGMAGGAPHEPPMEARFKQMVISGDGAPPGAAPEHVSWSYAADRRLEELVIQLGTLRWPEISARMPGYTLQECRERWYDYLAPARNRPLAGGIAALTRTFAAPPQTQSVAAARTHSPADELLRPAAMRVGPRAVASADVPDDAVVVRATAVDDAEMVTMARAGPVPFRAVAVGSESTPIAVAHTVGPGHVNGTSSNVSSRAGTPMRFGALGAVQALASVGTPTSVASQMSGGGGGGEEMLPRGWRVAENGTGGREYVSPDGAHHLPSVAAVRDHIAEREREGDRMSAALSTLRAAIDDTASASSRGPEQLVSLRASLAVEGPPGAAAEVANDTDATPAAAAPDSPYRSVLFTHPACLGHETTAEHMETDRRLRSVLAALAGPAFDALEWRSSAGPVESADVLAAHDPLYVTSVLAVCEVVERGTFNHLALDPPYSDTIVSRGTRHAVLCAARAVADAVDAVVGGSCRNAFAAVRPPGHHAERASAMGFCVLNNVAIAALRARRVHGLRRVAVLDFDTHAGNGTQSCLAPDPGCLYVSIHRAAVFPYTGMATERGAHNNVRNLPVNTAQGFRAAVTRARKALAAFRPELILISAGFDAHKEDMPQHSLLLDDRDFTRATEAVLDIADECCDGRVVSVLEGGYNPDCLARCVAAHVRQLMVRAAEGASDAIDD